MNETKMGFVAGAESSKPRIATPGFRRLNPGHIIVLVAWWAMPTLPAAAQALADDSPTVGKASKPPEVTKLTIRPKAAPVPALKYHFLPEMIEQTPGNAVVLYLRGMSPEFTAHRQRPEVIAKINKWTENMRQVPDAELRWVLTDKGLRDVDEAARRDSCDWEMANDLRTTKDPLGFSLPHIQQLRMFANLLAMRARLEIADGHFDQAASTLRTGFTLSWHTTQAPTLISTLVGAAIANLTLTQVEEFIQTPGSPNLYWALTDLPQPFINLRKGLQTERMWLNAVPELAELNKGPMNAGRMASLLEGVSDFLARAEEGGTIGGVRPSLGGVKIMVLGLTVKAYPNAKRFLIAQGKSPSEVEATPALQAVMMFSVHEFNRLFDEMYKLHTFPYWKVQPLFEGWNQQIKDSKVRMESIPFGPLLLPAIEKVFLATARVERRIAALRCIEAIRLYAAAHDGKLPATLADIKEVPIPIDPITGKDFEYKVVGEKATLYGRGPFQNAQDTYALRYELKLKPADVRPVVKYTSAVNDPAAARAVVDKAIKAAGGEANLAKLTIITLKTSGSFRNWPEGMVPATITADMWFSELDKARMDAQLKHPRGGRMVTGYSAAGGWGETNGRKAANDLQPDAGAKKLVWAIRAAQMLTPLKDKSVTLSFLGEGTLRDPRVGVRAAHDEHGEIDFHFDQETGLPAKADILEGLWPTDRDPVRLECVFSDYKDVEGVKHFTKVIMTGTANKKPLRIELTLSDIKPSAKLADELFVKP